MRSLGIGQEVAFHPASGLGVELVEVAPVVVQAVVLALLEGLERGLLAEQVSSALEEGEDRGLNDYRRDLDELDIETRGWVESNLLPNAERTHGALSALKRTVH